MAVKQKQSIRVREIESFMSKFSGENFLGIVDSKPYALVQKNSLMPSIICLIMALIHTPIG